MHNKFMHEAILEAKNSQEDLPIGAVIVYNNEIIAKAHNQKEEKNNPTLHAEIIAIQQACNILNSWRLDNTTIYVTLEPCPMCAWAIMNARIKNVYFGSWDLKYGAFGGAINLAKLANSKINIKGGIKEQECDKLLKDYFEKLRNEK